MQSTLDCNDGLHVAIVMDGNGRWASAQGFPRSAGHRAGVETIRRVCEAAPALGIATLTVFAFSADNWRRPRAEVHTLMGLLRRYLQTEIARLQESGIRLTVIGRRDRLPDGLAADIAAAEARTADGQKLHLRVALDYSARDAILHAAASFDRSAELTRESFGRLVAGDPACRSPRRRSADPHRRRETPLGLPAVGVRLRGALLHRPDVAGLRCRRSRRRDRRIPSA